MNRRKAIRWLATVVLVGAWFVFFRPAPLGGPLTIVWVRGTSMEPNFNGGDLVLVHRRPSYREGDAVAARVHSGAIVFHRIVGTGPDGFVTRGDNMRRPDPWTLAQDDVLGSEWIRLPNAGRFVVAAATPLGLAAMAAGLAFWVMLGSDGFFRRRTSSPPPPPPSSAPNPLAPPPSPAGGTGTVLAFPSGAAPSFRTDAPFGPPSVQPGTPPDRIGRSRFFRPAGAGGLASAHVAPWLGSGLNAAPQFARPKFQGRFAGGMPLALSVSGGVMTLRVAGGRP